MRATPTGLFKLSPADLQKLSLRFWSKVDNKSEEECWIWKGCCFRQGYGMFKVGSKNCKAHRVAYELTFGPANLDLKVLHSCDNVKCCNPNHLSEGTQLQNIYDTLERSKFFGNRKLSINDVHYIRRSEKPRAQLAEEFGVGKQMITDVRTRRRWGHIQ